LRNYLLFTQMKDIKFKIKFLRQNGYIKFCLTHPQFRGRIIKHIGKEETIPNYSLESIKLNAALDTFFAGKIVDRSEVNEFIDHYIHEQKIKCSILDLRDEFITKKRTTFNKQTNSYLSYCAINTYIKAIEYFDKFLTKKRISSDPSSINASVLDDYFVFLDGKSHNYKVKLHCKLKAYIKYAAKKGFQIDPSYADSTFTEEYDNQETEEDDRSLTKQELITLNNLRQVVAQGLFSLPVYKTTKSITEDLQKRQ